MKIRVNMKTPDALDRAIDECLEGLALDADDPDSNEAEDERQGYREACEEICGKWFRHGESVTLEIDTDAGTCVVVPAK